MRQHHKGAVSGLGHTVKVAVRRDNLFSPKAGGRLQAIDVLGEAAQELALVVEHLEERMRRRRCEITRPELAAQALERLGVVGIEAEIEDGFGIWQAIVSKVVVQPSARRAKIGDAG